LKRMAVEFSQNLLKRTEDRLKHAMQSGEDRSSPGLSDGPGNRTGTTGRLTIGEKQTLETEGGDDSGSDGVVLWRTPLATGTFPSARGGHTAVLYGHQIIIFGGHYHKGAGKFQYLNDMHILNLESLKWRCKKPSGDIPKPRYGHTATIFGNSMYVFGGRGKKGVVYRDIDRLNLKTWNWSKMSSTNMMPPARFGHSSTLVGDKIVIFGGYDGNKTYNDLWVFNIEKTTWIQPKMSGRSPQPRHGHTCVLGEEGGLVVFGGYQIEDGKRPVYLDDVRELNLQEMEWRRLSPSGILPVGRFGQTAAVHGNQMVVFGGYTGLPRRKIGATEMRDPKDRSPDVEPELDAESTLDYLHALDTGLLEWWQPSSEGEPPDLRYGHTMTYVGSGHYLIFGGWDGTRPLNSLVDMHIPEAG